MYYLCSENKGADQLRGYREADLRLCFRICKNPVFSRRGSNDEYHDPFCEPCEESRGRNVKVECFCKNSIQYLCIECHTTHESLRASRGHVIQTGDDMPKSMADKPPRYDTCDDHPKRLKDQFYCDHGTLICSACCSISHSKCYTKALLMSVNISNKTRLTNCVTSTKRTRPSC